MLSVGIDQHRKQLTVHVRDDQGEVFLRRQVSTQRDKVWEFLDDLDRRATPAAGYFATVEVYGFNDWLLRHLRARQPVCRQVFLIQPERQSYHKNPDSMNEGGPPLSWDQCIGESVVGALSGEIPCGGRNGTG